MQLTIDIVDAFTSRQFGGNAAAVIELDTWLSDEVLLAIAAQNNLSETAYLRKRDKGVYDIRWFSPITEIDFCGHATLAASFTVFERQPSLSKLVLKTTAVGDFTIERQPNGDIVMDFPARPPEEVRDVPSSLLSGLSIQPAAVLRSPQAFFAIYSDEQQVRALQTNSDELKRLAPYDVVATAPATDYDFVSRYFWPANGGDEDPVTGSIHTGLAPYWAGRLGKTQLMAYQASHRGGELTCDVKGDRVQITGRCVLYSRGTVFLS